MRELYSSTDSGGRRFLNSGFIVSSIGCPFLAREGRFRGDSGGSARRMGVCLARRAVARCGPFMPFSVFETFRVLRWVVFLSASMIFPK